MARPENNQSRVVAIDAINVMRAPDRKLVEQTVIASAVEVLGAALEGSARPHLRKQQAHKIVTDSVAIAQNAGSFMAVARGMEWNEWDKNMTYISAAYYTENIADQRKKEEQRKVRRETGAPSVVEVKLTPEELLQVRSARPGERARVMATVMAAAQARAAEQTGTADAPKDTTVDRILAEIDEKLTHYAEIHGISVEQQAELIVLANYVNESVIGNKDQEIKRRKKAGAFPYLAPPPAEGKADASQESPEDK